jgi:hypothetical protein
MYLNGGYEENADMELFHSDLENKENIVENLVTVMQIMSHLQVSERKELKKCF